MVFTDPFFLFAFLPLAAVLFFLVSRRFGRTAGLTVIFLSSIAFYAPWGWGNVAVLLSMLVMNFAAGSFMAGAPDARATARRRVLVGAQIANFAVLIWFKYQFLQTFLAGAGLKFADVAIPVGISFYTFHQAAFLVDAYRRDASVIAYLGDVGSVLGRAGAFLRFGAFVTFFPQLVIGPITYLNEFEPQTRSRSGFGRFSQTDVSIGLMLMAIGMFKKVVIADNLALIADPIFALAGDGMAINPVSAWIGVMAYYLQLYFDFSGYSDMALGIARIFGVRFPINFFSPLKSVGIVDFYKRWHMTLTRVISRFLFTPISLAATRFGARRRLPRGRLRAISLWVPLIINFEVIGLWHGALSTFIVFGLIHGAWFIAETEVRGARWWKAWQKRTPEGLRTLLGRAIFLAPMALTFALFRSEDLAAFGHLLTQLTPATLDVPRTGSALRALLTLAVPFAIIYLMPNSVQLLRDWQPGIMTYSHPLGPTSRWTGWLGGIVWRPDWVWSVVWLGLVISSLYFVARQPPFLYQGF